MIQKILQRPEFDQHPPVLIDVGASGRLHPIWRQIAPYSICIAFDADARDFNYATDETGKYRKLYTFNCIVTDSDAAEIDFHLTAHPHCSSLLRPQSELLQEYDFAWKFEIDRKIKLKNRSLNSVLAELKLEYVDWFKTDSQGLDWRLFENLGPCKNHVKVAEFEPGIISSYEGEDKMYTLLAGMEQNGHFWMSDFIVKGSPRIKANELNRFGKGGFWRKLHYFAHKQTPGWGEITYLNRFDNPDITLRDYLLGWVFAILCQQHGFGLLLIQKARLRFTDPVFDELETYTNQQISGRVWKLKFWHAVVLKYNDIFNT